jgi:hypothetical protein
MTLRTLFTGTGQEIQSVLEGFMTSKSAKKPKLTDAERHKRFVEMARQVGASDSPKAFDKAFRKVVTSKKKR